MWISHASSRDLHIDATRSPALALTLARECAWRARARGGTERYTYTRAPRRAASRSEPSEPRNPLTCNIVITRREALSPRRLLYLLFTVCPRTHTHTHTSVRARARAYTHAHARPRVSSSTILTHLHALARTLVACKWARRVPSPPPLCPLRSLQLSLSLSRSFARSSPGKEGRSWRSGSEAMALRSDFPLTLSAVAFRSGPFA